MAALDSGDTDYDTDTKDTVGTLESASTDTDWARANGASRAIVAMQEKLGVGLDGSEVDLAARLSVSDSKLSSMSLLIADNDSKSTSNSTVVSANLVTGDSKDVSQSTLISATESKVVSAH